MDRMLCDSPGFKALDEQRVKLLEDAKKEALDKAEKAVAELNELGFDYRLVEGASTARAPRKAGTEVPKRQARDLPCPICKFKTTPHHDGRMHGRKRPRSRSPSRNWWKGTSRRLGSFVLR
jgi:hypothetical protein